MICHLYSEIYRAFYLHGFFSIRNETLQRFISKVHLNCRYLAIGRYLDRCEANRSPIFGKIKQKQAQTMNKKDFDGNQFVMLGKIRRSPKRVPLPLPRASDPFPSEWHWPPNPPPPNRIFEVKILDIGLFLKQLFPFKSYPLRRQFLCTPLGNNTTIVAFLHLLLSAVHHLDQSYHPLINPTSIGR